MSFPPHLLPTALALLLSSLPASMLPTATAQDDAADSTAESTATTPQDPSPQAVRVPDGILDGGHGWLNTSQPISLKNLRGKVVLLDFWTYCCINCMHVLPELKYLEEKYPNELVVIGVHSAKFDNEKDTEAIRNAIMRHGIAHPVVNDSDMTIWRGFRVRAWPTLALIDPQGRYLGSRSGEGNVEVFDQVIERVIQYHRDIGRLNEDPIVFDLESGRAAPTALRYPGKVLADAASDRLFISDSSHNRIVVTDLKGQLVTTIGSGSLGHRDGTFEDAEFDHPQGTCLVGNTLYVADTENHLIRTVDLEAGTVGTLAGTGTKGRPSLGSGLLKTTDLNSPWALCHVDGTLYIAMAGPHQIWSHQLGSDQIKVYAGNAREDVVNGPLADSSFAQPSGLAVSSSADAVFVVDSEGSAIRRIGIGADAVVTTIAGSSELPRGRSLFTFGDVDDTGDAARFQHPIGIAQHGGLLYVADAYNHKIRQLDPQSGEVTTLLGDGTAGKSDSTDRLNEPAGLSAARNTLYIADTNSHRICAVDLETRTMKVLEVNGLEAPKLRSPEVTLNLDDAELVQGQQLLPGRSITVKVTLEIPAGGHLTDQAPVTWRVQPVSGQLVAPVSRKSGRATVEDGVAVFQLPMSPTANSGEFGLSVSWGYCDDNDSLCRLATKTWKIQASADVSGRSEILLPVPAPDDAPEAP